MEVNLAQGTAVGQGADTLICVEKVQTASGDDTVIGDDNANVLQAGYGNDSLLGRGGDDTLDGGSEPAGRG
jgi:Ca2+-binding RTX toxin-like protein